MKSTSYNAKQPDANGYIHYSPEEDTVWADLMEAQLPPIHEHMSRRYLEGLQRLDLPRNRIPQCREISEKLLPLTGWRVEPVPALIGFKQFFGMLASCHFPAASFIRSREDFNYIEEPDIFHEVLGHTPLLTHPQLANFSRKIGEAGLQVPKEDHAWLIRLYWFTIEFGLIREDGGIKALGSGLASSVSELEHARSSLPQLRPFDVMDILRTSYRIDIPQPVYFVINDLDDLLSITDRDLAADIRTARTMGIFPPLYPPKDQTEAG
ncbi:phenylalanine 4-monooxygenase [Kiloniella sp. b19]|uniref:phenylalanine 4-monooxygenase n=1 Tax=Kiloniella sp. GXU_MW_B19 TaxID=3141326 RepID=UPI0031D5BB5E